MPKYTKSDVRFTIRERDFEKIIRATKKPRDKMFLSLLYCTGARPSEIAGDKILGSKGMVFGDIVFKYEGVIVFHVPISKTRKDIYVVDRRPLELIYDVDKPDMAVRVIMKYIDDEIKRLKKLNLTLNPKTPIFTFSRRTGYNIVNRASKILGTEICPYNFRHSRLTQLAEQGAGIETLMYFKGSKNIQSIQPYLHAKKVMFSLKKERDDDREKERGS
jgi:site-specific recombinase XerD